MHYVLITRISTVIDYTIAELLIKKNYHDLKYAIT